MLIKFVLLVSVVCISPFLGGCATAVNGITQSVSINSVPMGATVQDGGTTIGVTPIQAELSRGRTHTLTFFKHGYQSTTFTINRKLSAATAGNLLIGGIPGIIVDAISGANFDLVPSNVIVRLMPINPSRDQYNGY